MDVSLQEQAKQLASQAETVEDLNSLMRLMMKSAMNGCSTRRWMFTWRQSGSSAVSHPTDSPSSTPATRANGRSRKKVQSELGEIPLETPRDRNSSFEPQLIGKHQRRISGFDEKIFGFVRQGDDDS